VSATPGPRREDLVRLVAERHGIRVEKDDPLFAVGTICEAHIDDASRRLNELIRQRIADFEAAVAKVQRRAGQLIAEEFNDRVVALRNELQKDVALAGAKANEAVFRVEQANRHAIIVRWTVIGCLSALLMFTLGVIVGWGYLPHR
jgi:CHASE3 domain sensor protein